MAVHLCTGTFLQRFRFSEQPHDSLCLSRALCRNPVAMSHHGRSPGNIATFNINDGYLEAEVRGYRGGILKRSDYVNLCQCETLDGAYCSLPQASYCFLVNLWFIFTIFLFLSFCVLFLSLCVVSVSVHAFDSCVCLLKCMYYYFVSPGIMKNSC
jgi:hypothetical protein